jgi:hypothetical protein
VDGDVLLWGRVDAGEGGGRFGVARREGGFELHVGHVWRCVARTGGGAPVDGVENACRVVGGSAAFVVLLFTAALPDVRAAGPLVAASSAGTWFVLFEPFGICYWVSWLIFM